MTNLTTLMQQIKLLSIDEQRALNSLLVANIRHAHKMSAITKSVEIVGGDYVQFDAKTRGIITMRVTGFSRDRTKIKGVQVNKGWNSRACRGVNWTAGANACKVIDKAEGERLAAIV